MKRFWVWLCRFAWLRAFGRKPSGVPVGLLGHRDPKARCEFYWPVKNPSYRGECQGDGHYLCRECERLAYDAAMGSGYIQIETEDAG